jgi:kynureninase
MNYQNTLSFAKELDTQDTLAKYRNEFFIPKNKEGKELIYFCGNSLGLQPKRVKEKIDQELLDWASLGVEAHFHGKNPWFSYHHFLTKESANLVGAKESEVVVMNSLSVNLNLLMISFYRPSAKRNKILIEGGAFPSDYYAVEQQIKLHGYNPEHSLVEMLPREGEYTLRTEDILAKIKELEEKLATAK